MAAKSPFKLSVGNSKFPTVEGMMNSVSKVLATQTRRPEFDSQDLCKKLAELVSSVEAEKGESLSQPT